MRLIDISCIVRIVQETPQRETTAFGLAVTKVARLCECSAAAVQGVGTPALISTACSLAMTRNSTFVIATSVTVSMMILNM
jgi:hypothetical protein